MNPDIDITISDDGVTVEYSKDLHLENSEHLRKWWLALSNSRFSEHKALGDLCKRMARIEYELSR